MSLVTMQALLADAEKGGYALGGFVTTDLMVTQSLIQASEEMGAPLILISHGERHWISTVRMSIFA